MTVEAPSLCAGYVLVHRSLGRLRPLLGAADVDGLPMLLLSPLEEQKEGVVVQLRPSGSYRRSAAA
jgi:hypothetical protein